MESVFSFFSLVLVGSAIVGPAISYEKVYFFHIVALCWLFSFIFMLYNKRISLFMTKLHLPLFLFFIWYVSSVFWSIDYKASIGYIGYLLSGMLIVLCCIYYCTSYERLLMVIKVTIIVCCIELVFSLLETSALFRLPVSPYSSFLGFSFQGLNPSQIIYMATTPTGFAWNPNNLCVVILLVLPFLLNSSNRMLVTVSWCSTLYLIIMASSRGAYLVLLGVTTGYLMLNDRMGFYQKLSRIILFFLFCIVLGCFSSNFSIKNVKQIKGYSDVFLFKTNEVTNAFNVTLSFAGKVSNYLNKEQLTQKDKSIDQRATLIALGVKALKDTKLLGVGAGCSKIFVKRETGKIFSMHNFWLEVVTDSGIVGAIILFSWYSWVLHSLYCVEDRSIKKISTSLFLSLIGFSTAAMIPSSTIYMLPMWLFWGIAIAFIDLTRRRDPTTESPLDS